MKEILQSIICEVEMKCTVDTSNDHTTADKRGLTICSNLAHSCYPHHCQQLMGEKMIAFSGKAQTLWIPLTSWQLTKQALQSMICDEVHICYLYLQPHFSEGRGVAILREGSARHYLYHQHLFNRWELSCDSWWSTHLLLPHLTPF